MVEHNLLYEHIILMVDDEPSILKALTRCFRKLPCTLKTAGSGAEGLAILKESKRAVSLILSDQRMPEMDGATFLEKSRTIFPYASRFLLTGYSDLAALTHAINKGGIHRFLSKPWDDAVLLDTVVEGLRQYELILENKRLIALTTRQNQELEKKVAERTCEVNRKHAALTKANRSLQEGFYNTVRALASVLDMSTPSLAGHGRRVSELSLAMARQMGLKSLDVMQVEVAALLHDIGKAGFSEALTRTMPQDMSRDDQIRYRSHPEQGQNILRVIPQLDGVGLLIRHHHERYDGEGFPDGLSETEIPLGARIISVADAFDRTLHNPALSSAAVKSYLREKDTTQEYGKGDTLLRQAAAFRIKQNAFSQHDPDVVKSLLDILKSQGVTSKAEQSIPFHKLRAGMRLTRPLYTTQGRYLLPYETPVTEDLLYRLHKLHRNEPIQEPVMIQPVP